jgi:CHAT domain
MGSRELQQATVRTTNLWLTEPDRQRAIGPGEALVSLQPYTLHLNIAPPRAEALLSTRFPFEILEPLAQERYLLDVTFFSPDTDFQLETRKAILELPHAGASNEIAVVIIPRSAGKRRLRACIYYHNVLLQSVLLEATVVDEGGPVPDGASIACTMDYVASTDLALLDELPRPTLSLFTNQAGDGTHWIGVFGTDEAAGIQIRQGDMHTFDPGWLATRAERLRDLLAEIEGKKAYRFEAHPPFSGREQEGREKDLVDLALAGWKLYDDLFLSHQAGLDMDRLTDLRAALQLPGLVSVARCRGDSTTIPWAALYDLPLDTGKGDEIKLCPVFTAQLAANRWSSDGTELVEKHDLLDDPPQCRRQAGCPLGDRKLRRLTICPLGFWGILHQVEQPLQQVTPTPVDQVPEELEYPGFNQTSFLVRPGEEKVRMAMGIYPGIPDAEDHRLEIAALAPSTLEVSSNEDRDQVLTMLEEGGYHVYYFYCHGQVEGGEFKLKLGPAASPGYIASADLDPFEIRWEDQRQPLVILNGCETMALTPELIHGFLGKLRRVGALGIVGTEVKVWTQLARPLGRFVLKHVFEGTSLGEAFLEARKHLLRQYNPLGLVYTLHAPATLHLHDPAGCDWCRMRLPAGLAWNGG